MKIRCFCGNVIRDQTDYIPYKAYFVADQDYFDLIELIEEELALSFKSLVGTPPTAGQADSLGRLSHVLRDAMSLYKRPMFQCCNCGRLCLEDPDNRRALQWFQPEDKRAWKRVLASVKGEGSKAWRGNLVGYWDPSRSQGQLWYDPPTGERGGYEEFTDRASFENRYYELFERLKEDGHLVGARLGAGSEGEPIRDVHRWSLRR
jgi:hypothetical protein